MADASIASRGKTTWKACPSEKDKRLLPALDIYSIHHMQKRKVRPSKVVSEGINSPVQAHVFLNNLYLRAVEALYCSSAYSGMLNDYSMRKSDVCLNSDRLRQMKGHKLVTRSLNKSQLFKKKFFEEIWKN
ncbi:hypothetical protein Y032_0012g1736 [Ancylostoma ceylanicum]|uniref:Uncharacterized protein n=1 Tax=Ancylostoma ceylanicum TaxID=53326 RepID=A0A016VEK1_9BILA|nr:hypothetical protein Y032_0012g1736 [Ancylostoma ceylanicum]